jgi:hypothetical protein
MRHDPLLGSMASKLNDRFVVDSQLSKLTATGAEHNSIELQAVAPSHDFELAANGILDRNDWPDLERESW